MNYQETRAQNEKELNDFKGIFFAFSNDQLTEGMKGLGLTMDDLSQITSFGAGTYCLKTRSKAFHAMFKKAEKATADCLKDPEHLKTALIYELGNHEYCITWDTEPTLDALGLTESEIPAGLLQEAVDEYNTAQH